MLSGQGILGPRAAIVKRLASEGANVALTYSNSPDRTTRGWLHHRCELDD
jgi:hypothetical protein